MAILSVKGISYKSRAQRKIYRYRISATIRNQNRESKRKAKVEKDQNRILFVYIKTLSNVKQIIKKLWQLVQSFENFSISGGLYITQSVEHL